MIIPANDKNLHTKKKLWLVLGHTCQRH